MGHRSQHPDGVETQQATAADLQTFSRAQSDLQRMRVPVLLHRDNPHEYLYVAALDGTGNSMRKDSPENWSSVARIYNQIES